MSQENVGLVRDLYELVPSLLEADPENVDRALRGYADDQFELHLPPDYPEGEQVFRGREGMNALIASLRETWSEWRMVPERFLSRATPSRPSAVGVSDVAGKRRAR